MCGVFLVYSKKKKILDISKCKLATKDLFNRGPDYFKYNVFKNGSLYISNTILSITGKPHLGKYLISSKKKNYHISFNGQIYNYLSLKKKYLNNFVTQKKNITDTEILINLYEKKQHKNIPKLLNGMYAYIVFDTIKDKLQIVNDTQGEKNLYYYDNEDFLIVSSTIKSIKNYLNLKDLNKEVIKNYFFTRHFMPLENTCYKNLKLFKNGTINFFDLKKFNLKSYVYDDPLNWISKKKYNYYKNLGEEKLINLIDKELNNQAKIMIPKKQFSCIVSGGIDSTLQAKILSKYKKANFYSVIDHGKKKDHIMEYINKFNKYFPKNINKIKLNGKKYVKLLKNCYNLISSPLQTHDLPGRLHLANFFKKKKTHVFFSADGCDELLGRQQLYEKVFNKKFNFKKNNSPYSSLNIIKNFKPSLTIKNNLEKNWIKVLDKYSFIKNKKERNIQSSLYMDYFFQSINVANRSNDLICCSRSLEPRNLFISKNLLKIFINLPLIYKINYKIKDKKFRQKYILKKIFTRYFSDDLIFEKAGFSGFPSKVNYTKNKFSKIDKLIGFKNLHSLRYKNYYDKINNKRDIEWKKKNLENFLKLSV